MTPLVFDRRPNVFVIGGAHLDAIGNYTIEERDKVDKVGTVVLSIGGTAYNIATNIATTNKVRTFFYTHLKPQSPISNIITSHLILGNVDIRFVLSDQSIDQESAFIAHNFNGELQSAITASLLEKVELNTTYLEKGIKLSEVVVADCNLSTAQLDTIGWICQSLSRPFVVSGVSQTKCKRALEASAPITYLSLNEVESKELGDVEQLLAKGKIRNLIITKAAKGWSILSTGKTLDFPAPTFQDICNTSGAGDALLSAIILELAIEGQLTMEGVYGTAYEMIGATLKKKVASGKNVGYLENPKIAVALPKTGLK